MMNAIQGVIFAAALAASGESSLHVALIGDSLAYGAGDEQGRGISGRLEPELRKRGIDAVRTTNLGRNGATTRDVTARLQDAAARKAIAGADAIVLSIGANDLVRAAISGDVSSSPLALANEILDRIDAIVSGIRAINPAARILLLGAYNPAPDEAVAIVVDPLLAMWETSLIAHFAADPRVSVVRLTDIVDRRERLSRIDGFHPGGEAYQEAARRIAELLTSVDRPEARQVVGERQNEQ